MKMKVKDKIIAAGRSRMEAEIIRCSLMSVAILNYDAAQSV
jgi:hypothetical protein